MSTLRQRWAAGEETLGAWLSAPSSVVAEMVARVGFDFVCVDTQHGAIEYQTAVAMFQAILLGGGTPICRVPWNEPGIIGKMLDAGSTGVIVPMVNSVAEAEAVVRACHYPALGARSFGPVMSLARDAGYYAGARLSTAVIPMIETVQAVERIDEILSVPGIDAIYVGPADLSISLGLPPGNNDDSQLFTDALLTIVAACRRAGVVPGIHATGPLAGLRREQGFRFVTVAGDLLAMRRALAAELDQSRTIAPTTTPPSGPLY
jgi:4-hydroxy-2-oxoheptanedioate aldolase